MQVPNHCAERTIPAYLPGSLDRIVSAWHAQKVDLCRISAEIPEP
jgi:hypothetical protein